MTQIRWKRVAIATVVLFAIFAAVSFWQVQNDPVNDTDIDIDLIVPGCIVKFAPDGSSQVVPFGDARCPK